MKAVLVPAVAAILAVTGACVQDDAAGEAIFTPEVTGTAALPLSESDAVSLLADERIACVADSYETRVRCVDLDGGVVGVFGRKGEGPGEFDSPAYLARGEQGTVGVHDPGLGRFTVFEPSGAYVSEVLAPLLDVPFRSFGTVLSGVEADVMVMLGVETSGSLMTRYDVNLATGEVVREEASPEGPWDVACGEVPWGIPDRAGGWVFVACEGHLIFVGDTGEAKVLRAPTHLAELPDERDAARFEEMLMALNRANDRPASESVDERLEDYRATPKKYFLSTADQLVDAANRYWVATQRDTHEWSYLDVYENAEYVGSVKVRDRLKGFDLLGSTSRGGCRYRILSQITTSCWTSRFCCDSRNWFISLCRTFTGRKRRPMMARRGLLIRRTWLASTSSTRWLSTGVARTQYLACMSMVFSWISTKE